MSTQTPLWSVVVTADRSQQGSRSGAALTAALTSDESHGLTSRRRRASTRRQWGDPTGRSGAGAPRAPSASRPPSFPMRRAGGRGEVTALAPPLHAVRMCRTVLSDTDPPAVSSDPKTGESRSACARRETDEHQGPDLAVAAAFHLERLLAVEHTEKLTCWFAFGSRFSPRLSRSFFLGAGGKSHFLGPKRP